MEGKGDERNWGAIHKELIRVKKGERKRREREKERDRDREKERLREAWLNPDLMKAFPFLFLSLFIY